jgi:hypothetical protein
MGGAGTVLPIARVPLHPLHALGAPHGAARAGAAHLTGCSTVVVVEAGDRTVRVSAQLDGLPMETGLPVEVHQGHRPAECLHQRPRQLGGAGRRGLEPLRRGPQDAQPGDLRRPHIRVEGGRHRRRCHRVHRDQWQRQLVRQPAGHQRHLAAGSSPTRTEAGSAPERMAASRADCRARATHSAQFPEPNQNSRSTVAEASPVAAPNAAANTASAGRTGSGVPNPGSREACAPTSTTGAAPGPRRPGATPPGARPRSLGCRTARSPGPNAGWCAPHDGVPLCGRRGMRTRVARPTGDPRAPRWTAPSPGNVRARRGRRCAGAPGTARPCRAGALLAGGPAKHRDRCAAGAAAPVVGHHGTVSFAVYVAGNTAALERESRQRSLLLEMLDQGEARTPRTVERAAALGWRLAHRRTAGGEGDAR